MEKINLFELAKAELLISLYLLPFILVAYYILRKWGTTTLQNDLAAESEYENRYRKIQNMIDDYPVVPGNYEILHNEIDLLRKLPYKNREKTQVLYEEFRKKFRKNEFFCDYAPSKQCDKVDTAGMNMISCDQCENYKYKIRTTGAIPIAARLYKPSVADIKRAEEKIVEFSN